MNREIHSTSVHILAYIFPTRAPLPGTIFRKLNPPPGEVTRPITCMGPVFIGGSHVCWTTCCACCLYFRRSTYGRGVWHLTREREGAACCESRADYQSSSSWRPADTQARERFQGEALAPPPRSRALWKHRGPRSPDFRRDACGRAKSRTVGWTGRWAARILSYGCTA